MKKHNGRGYVRQKYCELRKRNQSYCHLLSVGPGRHSFNSRASHFFNLFSFPRCSPYPNSLYACLPLLLFLALSSENFKDNEIFCKSIKTSSTDVCFDPEPLAVTPHPPTPPLLLASPAKYMRIKSGFFFLTQMQLSFFHVILMCKFYTKQICRMSLQLQQWPHRTDGRKWSFLWGKSISFSNVLQVIHLTMKKREKKSIPPKSIKMHKVNTNMHLCFHSAVVWLLQLSGLRI